MYLILNIFDVAVDEEVPIGELFLELLDVLWAQFRELGGMWTFWVVLVIVITTLLMATIKSRNSDSAIGKIGEALYDSSSILISLFYNIVGIASVVLNFIRTLTEMLFGDLSENLLKKLFAFAIIAFSITSFSTTLQGMQDLFKYFAGLVSFGLQILILGLAYKIVLSTESICDRLKIQPPNREKIYKKTMVLPLITISLFIFVPICVLVLYNFERILWICVTVIAIGVILLFTLAVQVVSAFYGNYKEVYKNSFAFQGRIIVVYIVLGLAIFTSSFFSYTSISDKFIKNQIDTDYLIATSTRAVESLDEMDTAMDDAADNMVHTANKLLDTLINYRTFNLNGELISYEPVSFSDAYNGKIDEIIDSIKISIDADKKIAQSDYNRQKEINDGVDEEIAQGNLRGWEIENLKREADYDFIVIIENCLNALSDFNINNEHSISGLKTYIKAIVNYNESKGARDSSIDAYKIEQDYNVYIDEYNGIIGKFEEGIQNRFDIGTDKYIEFGDSVSVIRPFLMNIRYYQNYPNALSDQELQDSLNSLRSVVSENDDLTLEIGVDNVTSLNNNLLEIKEYYSKKQNAESTPQEDVQEQVQGHFSDVFSDKKNAEKKTAKDASLNILNVVFQEVINYPALENIVDTEKMDGYTPVSFVELEQDVYVQIRILNGQMKPFEKYFRKLFDKDAFPEMAIFALFIALLIDIAAVMLFILRGKEGPFGDSKLNSKRVIFLHAVDNDKKPKKMQSSVWGTICNTAGALLGLIYYLIYSRSAAGTMNITMVIVFIVSGMILLNLAKTILVAVRNMIKYRGPSNKKYNTDKSGPDNMKSSNEDKDNADENKPQYMQSSSESKDTTDESVSDNKQSSGKTKENIDENAYEQFTLKYDTDSASGIDKFYENDPFAEMFDEDRTGYYFTKLYWRYIERLRDRYLDSFVLFLCNIKALDENDKKEISGLIKEQIIDEDIEDAYKDKMATKASKAYVASITHDEAKDFNVLPLLLSLFAYDKTILLTGKTKYYIHNNFFKYVNELLWSRNSQYSNYGLDYTDYDIEENGVGK